MKTITILEKNDVIKYNEKYYVVVGHEYREPRNFGHDVLFYSVHDIDIDEHTVKVTDNPSVFGIVDECSNKPPYEYCGTLSQFREEMNKKLNDNGTKWWVYYHTNRGEIVDAGKFLSRESAIAQKDVLIATKKTNIYKIHMVKVEI